MSVLISTRSDLAIEKDFTKKYKKSRRDILKKPRKSKTPPIIVTRQPPKADKFSKISLKVVQEDFGNICKKPY